MLAHGLEFKEKMLLLIFLFSDVYDLKSTWFELHLNNIKNYV